MPMRQIFSEQGFSLNSYKYTKCLALSLTLQLFNCYFCFTTETMIDLSLQVPMSIYGLYRMIALHLLQQQLRQFDLINYVCSVIAYFVLTLSLLCMNIIVFEQINVVRFVFIKMQFREYICSQKGVKMLNSGIKHVFT